MTQPILHHYAISPYAEKIRRVLAWKQLAWQSVTIPPVMPKPDVVALTGGYRKTPILQIGSDIYCDTALICDVLEHLQPAPSLYPARAKGLARILAQWADSALFWAAMGHNFTPQGVQQLFPLAGGTSQQVFSDDRASMRQGMARARAQDAASAYRSYLRRLADMLDGQHYLLGDRPAVADFAAYHPLWFTRVCTPAVASILDATPSVLRWMDRIAAVPDSRVGDLDAGAALLVAATQALRKPLADTFQDDHGLPLGSQVSIASDIFGVEPSVGELVAATRMHYTIRRTDPRAGTLHVHFPRIGYVLRAATAT